MNIEQFIPSLRSASVLFAYIEAAEDGKHAPQAEALFVHAEQLIKDGQSLPLELVQYLERARCRLSRGVQLHRAFNLPNPSNRPNHTAGRNFDIAVEVRNLMDQGNTLEIATEKVSRNRHRCPETLRDIYAKYKWLIEPEKWPELTAQPHS